MNLNRPTFIAMITAGLAGLFISSFFSLQAAESGAKATILTLKSGWDKPARTYKPHTRWWWPGNALTKVDITWQLEQMAAQGLGGVEIMNTWKMYEKGNIEYLTPQFMELVKHTVAEAKRLDIEVAITFSPGWGFGGANVPKEDQSKALCLSVKDLDGGAKFSGSLPVPELKGVREKGSSGPRLPSAVVAVVAGRIAGDGKLDADSLTVLTGRVKAGEVTLEWDVPKGDGKWRLMTFWLEFTGQECSAQNFYPPAMVVDHMNRRAVQRYCEQMGGALEKVIGTEFGRTVDSFFCDSFEFWPLSNALLWSGDTLAGFKKHAGYDFAKYLPAIWYDIGPVTPRVRYDLGDYLHHVALDNFFKPFNEWCDAHHVQARIQPHYRFTEELVQGAGASARPETEVTTARFEPVADPRKATASGARFYGREIVSAEAYTFIHPARYRTDLQDLKIATDAFLRDGITQFYNHGYFASPEKHVAPTRDFPWANRIGHWNTWWKYYHHMAEYVARCCSVLRQGRLVADVLIYSPQATVWSERANWGSTRRVMPYGNLAKTLVANGYDFDIVNDDLLQHRAKFRDGRLEINGYEYRMLIMPRATVVPIETMRAIRAFVKAGGTVVALDELPSVTAGLKGSEKKDRELKKIVADLFSADPERQTGGIFLPEYKIEKKGFNPGRQTWTPTPPLNAAQSRLIALLVNLTPPDFRLASGVQSDGLTFIHKRMGEVDVYFVCNLQPNRIAADVRFRVINKVPQRWDAITGETSTLPCYGADTNGTTIAVDFEPWQSAFYVFAPGTPPVQKNVEQAHGVLPASLAVNGLWNMKLEGYGFETFETNSNALVSWTDVPRTRHFSGTGRYEVEFEVSADRLANRGSVFLDLGQVGTVAEVELNGQAVGVAWMAPYRVDVRKAIHAGKNRLVVFVTNTLINYVSGLKEAPEVPIDLQPRLGKANPAVYPEGGSAQHEMSETDLPPSGLLGPVRIVWRDTAPRAPGYYEGREPDAIWRKSAAERIEKYRKSDLAVSVVDDKGKPVPDAAVNVKMTRQAFPFGSCVSAGRLVRMKGADADRYRKMVDELFTHVTVEIESCQIRWERDKTVALDAMKWLKEHGKTIHGCHIIWPHPDDGLPKDIVAMKSDPAAMRKRIMGHIEEKLTACKGLVSEWNAVNELFTNPLIEETLGKAFIPEIFKRAKQIDPTVRLDLNDFGDMANASRAHLEGSLEWIRYAKEQGTMLDVVGLQCHFNPFLRPMDESYAILERYAAMGYPIHVTELDVNIRDEQLQADFMRDMMTMLYSHPAVEKITLWGFWERSHWMPLAALWRKDWSIKPIGEAWMNLVKTKWRTNVDLQTDKRGTAKVRAFHGDYEITATAGSKTTKITATVGRDGATAVLRFE